jgi:hypothetical protein
MDRLDVDGERPVDLGDVREVDSKVAPPALTAFVEVFARFQRLSMALS